MIALRSVAALPMPTLPKKEPIALRFAQSRVRVSGRALVFVRKARVFRLVAA